MKITLQLFGAFRAIGNETQLDVPEGASVEDLAVATGAFLSAQGREDLMETLSVSRFATEKIVLAKGAPLGDERCFAVLPPVSGG